MELRKIVNGFNQQALMLGLSFVLAGCLPSAEVDSPEQKQTDTQQPGQNSAPTINGSPGSQATPGQTYVFQPAASDPDGDSLTYTVQGLPRWASFDSSNGSISGTPDTGDVAAYSGISITVSDGQATAQLGPFTITVDAVAMGSATLAWTPPVLNTDGSPLVDLAGYRIYWGATSGSYTQSVTVDNPGLTSYVVDNLTAGNWYFVSTALNAAGVESSYSNEALKIVNN